MQKGIVKWFNSEKGYGFIQPEDGGNDIFVHISALHEAGIKSLADGQEVQFEVHEDTARNKTNATNLQVNG